MRFEKIPAILLVLFLALAASVSAQVDVDCFNYWFRDCAFIDESSQDIVGISDFSGRPGDTVWMPVYLITNDTISGFEILIKYDPTVLKPVTNEGTPEYPGDTVFFFTELAGALLEAQNLQDQGGDTKELFFARLSEQAVDTNVIMCSFNLGFGGQAGDTLGGAKMIPPINGVIFRLPFTTDANTVFDGDTALFSYQEGNELVLTDTAQQVYWCTDCRRTNMSWDSDCEVLLVDTNTIPWDSIIDTVTCTSTLYPTTINGVFTADETPPPQMVSFVASPDSVGPGDPFVLTWQVTNADSVFITGTNVNFVGTGLTGNHIATAPGSNGTYTYKLKATNEFDADSTTTQLLVKSGGEPPPQGQPVINVNTVHFVDVGNTLVFTVSATDPDNDFITLEATDLPANATFPTVTGTGSASGTFTFTPTLNQAGVVTATFRASDGNTTPATVTVQINIAEPAFDKLFTSSTEKSAAGGIPGKSSFLFPVNLVTTQTVYGVQFDFFFDEQNFNFNYILTNHNTPEYVHYQYGLGPGEVRVLAFGMANEPIGTDGTEILQIDMAVEAGAQPGRYPVYFKNAWESISPDPDFPSLPLIADTGVIQVDMYGDVNLNLSVDIADLVSIVGHIIAAYTLNQRQIDAGDVNFDAGVNVFDLVAIINMILTGASPVSPGLTYEDQYAKVQLDFDDLQQGESDMVIVRFDLPTDIAGVELEILYDPATVFLGRPVQGEDAQNMSINFSNNGGGKLKVLLHSGDPFGAGGSIGAGEVELVRIPITTNENVDSGDTTQIKLSKALLSTSSATAVRVEGLDAPLPTSFTVAQNYPNPFNPITTIEFSFGPNAQNVRLDIFNIIGQKVTTLVDGFLQPGNHTVDWNATDDYGQKIASGVYLYKLQIDAESQTKKMLLLK